MASTSFWFCMEKLQCADHVVHAVKACSLAHKEMCGAHGTRGKDLARCRAVRQGNDLVLARKQDLVLAHDRAAAYGMQTDLAACALTALGVAVKDLRDAPRAAPR